MSKDRKTEGAYFWGGGNIQEMGRNTVLQEGGHGCDHVSVNKALVIQA